ncbi:MAG TPA: hypothetical protein VKQ30_14995, partial [Ktedonobacterales bacterium]|nr:hypothetical protein [Ktedonobacterales bacterium]
MSMRLDEAGGQAQWRTRLAWWGRRTLGIIWLVALALPTANLLDQHPDPARLILSLAGVALFAAIFAIVMV